MRPNACSPHLIEGDAGECWSGHPSGEDSRVRMARSGMVAGREDVIVGGALVRAAIVEPSTGRAVSCPRTTFPMASPPASAEGAGGCQASGAGAARLAVQLTMAHYEVAQDLCRCSWPTCSRSARRWLVPSEIGPGCTVVGLLEHDHHQ